MRDIGSLRPTDPGESPMAAGGRGRDPHTGREKTRFYWYSKQRAFCGRYHLAGPARMCTASQEAGRPWLPASKQIMLLSDKQHSQGVRGPWLPATSSDWARSLPSPTTDYAGPIQSKFVGNFFHLDQILKLCGGWFLKSEMVPGENTLVGRCIRLLLPWENQSQPVWFLLFVLGVW